jgi:hypothetical protein
VILCQCQKKITKKEHNGILSTIFAQGAFVRTLILFPDAIFALIAPKSRSSTKKGTENHTKKNCQNIKRKREKNTQSLACALCVESQTTQQTSVVVFVAQKQERAHESTGNKKQTISRTGEVMACAIIATSVSLLMDIECANRALMTCER